MTHRNPETGYLFNLKVFLSTVDVKCRNEKIRTCMAIVAIRLWTVQWRCRTVW